MKYTVYCNFNKLTNNDRKYLHVYVRNHIIDFIKECDLYMNYSKFNRNWNDEMRQQFGLPENYINVFEFEYLYKLAEKNKRFKLNLLNRIIYYLIPMPFKSWCDVSTQNWNILQSPINWIPH